MKLGAVHDGEQSIKQVLPLALQVLLTNAAKSQLAANTNDLFPSATASLNK